ncbi:MAG TPA: hypothetical protein PKU97_21425, partial [Kofleriaceae bacterium]|nr:hypothetical protein [Kofleriaceae bacterium]
MPLCICDGTTVAANGDGADPGSPAGVENDGGGANIGLGGGAAAAAGATAEKEEVDGGAAGRAGGGVGAPND